MDIPQTYPQKGKHFLNFSGFFLDELLFFGDFIVQGQNMLIRSGNAVMQIGNLRLQVFDGLPFFLQFFRRDL